MLQYLSRLNRSRRGRTAVLVSALVTGLVAGMLSGVPVAPPTAAAAGCGVSFVGCGADGTATASVNVSHRYWDEDLQQSFYVEPVDTDTWLVTAEWYSPVGGLVCPCTQLSSAQATVTVTWSDATQDWTATCTAGCNSSTGPIYGVSVCPAGGCGGDPPSVPFDHSWEYELMVDIDHTLPLHDCTGGTNTPYLTSVAFAATDLDDGDVIDECGHSTTVTPDMLDPIGAADDGTFECAYSCNSVAGPSVTIDYVLP